MPAKYQEQYDRMKRWYDRFVVLAQSRRRHNIPSDNYLDEIYAFFQNCYHLKDWIKHDPSVAAPIQQAVELHIDSSRPLKLCADLCNSLKHLENRNRSRENPQFRTKRFTLTLGSGPTTIGLQYYEVETDTGRIDAFTLGTECVAAWDAFLTGNGLKS